MDTWFIVNGVMIGSILTIMIIIAICELMK
jgi:hypothetical protein